jgi:RNA polymerase sigma-70 factor, ECF subfamily
MAEKPSAGWLAKSGRSRGEVVLFPKPPRLPAARRKSSLAAAQLYGAPSVRYNVLVMARSDVQLMLDVKAGDESSFDELLQRYRTHVVNFLQRMVRDQATAEDLAQEVFLRVYNARNKYIPSAKFTTWLFRIASNLALNSLRDGRHRQKEISLDASPEEDSYALDVPSREPRVDERLMERDRANSIRMAIERLPEKQRAAVLMHKYQEMEYVDIAEALDCSESALKSLLFRAYETLRVDLAPMIGAPAAMRAGGGR